MQYSLEYAKMSSGYFRDFFWILLWPLHPFRSNFIQLQPSSNCCCCFVLFFPFFWVEIPNITVENNELKEH